MKWFPRGTWRYAVLILLLLALAAWASLTTISSIEAYVLSRGGEGAHEEMFRDTIRIITLPILALTMGFLCLSGALGIWAIRSTAALEARRRVGRFVDAMDYLSDGLLAVDRHGRIAGSNPAARELAGREVGPKALLREMFPCLTAEDERLLLSRTAPEEVDRVRREARRLRAYRFRSQPSEDMSLILVSDVTGQKAQEMRGRQIARLQLIGRIARGVAHDFNDILSAVSGHASLIERQQAPRKDTAASLKAIIRESQRGATLARQVLELSQTGVRGNPCDRLAEHAENSANLLRVGLAEEWQVVVSVEGLFPPVAVTDVQVEQIIVNLGLLAADELPSPGFVHIRVRAPAREPLLDVGEQYSAVILIAAYSSSQDLFPENLRAEARGGAAVEPGVVQSVVRSMLEEVEGRLDILLAPSGSRESYRVCLPAAAAAGRASALANLPEELRAYIANWHVLVASPVPERRMGIAEHLRELGLTADTAGDIVSALQQVEAGHDLSAMVLDKALLGEEADPLLRAILKLRPYAGLVVLCDDTEKAPQNMKSDMVFEAVTTSPEAIVYALLRAKELAGSRKRA